MDRSRRSWVALFAAVVTVMTGAPAVVAASGPPPTEAAAVTGGYQALSPARLLDTRSTGSTVDGQFKGGGPLGAGATKTVKITGRGGVPASEVAAVVLNVTAVRATSSAFITVFPAGEARPNASNINVVAGDVSPNLVVVKIPTSGSVSLFLSGGASDLLADVAGYYPTGGSFASLSPGRLLDTRATGVTVDGQARAGGALGPAGIRELEVAGRHGIPTTGVDAVVLNVTGVRPTTGTYLSVWPTGSTRPNASNLNLATGEVKPNLVVAKLGAGGKVSFFNAGGKVDVLADVAGWIPTGTTYKALTPGRLLDTRPTGSSVDGINQRSGPVGAAKTVDVQVTGRYGIPASGVTAVVLNVTGVAPTGSTYVTAYTAGEARPNASNLNLVRNETRPNLVFVKVGASGKVSLFNASGSVNLLADVAGYFGDGTTPPPPPTITTASLPNATVGTAYGQTLAASGGTTPYVWSLTSGTLPAGLTLVQSTGTISGTPTTAGARTFTVQVKDAKGAIATKSLTITVSAVPPGPSITTTTLANATVGSGYDQALTATGGSTPYAWSLSSGTLPAGLSLNASTGRITGTPTTTGTAFFTVQVRDAAARTATRGLLIEVDPAGAGIIRGTVTDTSASPKPLGGVRVVLRSARRAINRDATTTAAGAYSFTGLPASSDYTVCFSGAAAIGGASDATGYAGSCHAENTETGTPGHINLPSSTTRTINRALKPGAAISGKVSNSAATPAGISGVAVGASVASGSYSSPFPANATTTSTGTYVLKGLRPGSYEVCFDTSSINFGATTPTGYLEECWNDRRAGDLPTVLAVTAGATRTGVDAALAAAGAVTGKVTDAVTGAALVGVSVQLSGPSFGFATTSATGAWTVRGLETGTYEACFEDFGAVTGGSVNGYLAECWNDQPRGSGTAVAVTAGTTKSGIDAGLTAGGRITGKVTTPSAAPVPSVSVEIYSSAGSFLDSAFTAADGTYAAKGLQAGNYKVCFSPNDDQWAGECWNDKTSVATATAVSLAAGGTTPNINAVLALGGALTGKVTEAGGTAKPLGDVEVSISSNAADSFGFTRTASDGTYRVAGLNPGTDYRVCFDGRNGTGGANDVRGYVDECWNDKVTGASDPVTITSGGTTTGVNAALSPAGAISGKVTQAASTLNLAGVTVTARSATNFTTERAVTDVDGTYTINVLAPAANYTVCFTQTYGGNGGTNDALGYVEQCWQNKPIGQTPTAVAVAAASTRTGVNAALADAGGISGTVTDAGTAKLRGVQVSVSTGTSTLQTVLSGADGTYRLNGLAPGTAYAVCFEGGGALGGAGDTVGYMSECWNNQPTRTTATAVAVTAGAATPSINASLASASGISGTVTEAGSGRTLEEVSVQVESASLGIFEFASTAANGAWSVKGLPPAADYVVCFDPGFASGGTSTTGLVEQCWNNKPDEATATKVTTTAGAMRTGVGAVIAAAGGISGKVTAAVGGAPLAEVDIFISNDTAFEFATTAADGTWKVIGLAPATDYVVCFQSVTVGGVDYFGECWNNQPDESTATKVAVTAGAVVPNVNGTLAQAGGISGKVTAQTGGSALPGVDVSITNDTTFESTTTAADGTWSVSGLAPASDYVVCFAETLVGGVTYFQECWNNQPDESTATKVIVTGGATTPNINGTLGSAGGVSGKVTAVGGAALADVEVTVQSETTFAFEFATTAADGTWSVSDLAPAADYVVCFDGSFASGGPSVNGYGRECWDNKTDESTATKVVVPSGTTKTGVNAVLDPLP